MIRAWALAIVLAIGAVPRADAQTSTVVFGTRHAVALRENGDVLTWGDGPCLLGRTSAQVGDPPSLVMRHAKEVAAASEHTLVLTQDGRVYAWGINAEGALGLPEGSPRCEGPVLVQALASETIVHVVTGYGFSAVVTASGDLYCSGDNSMEQCPVARASRVTSFTKVPFQELAGQVATLTAGMFHTLVVTKDGKLYAFGRGRDGQLGNGRTANGFTAIPDLTGVVSIAAGTWHSAAVGADGSVWTWGNNSKSQLCDGTTTNRATPTRIAIPGGLKATRVIAAGHSTIIQMSDGSLFACGDNQAGLLGLDALTVAPRPTRIPVTATPSSIVAMGGAQTAIATGCTTSLAGDNAALLVSQTSTASTRRFAVRANLSLCGARPATTLATIVHPAPTGGASGCWMPHPDLDVSRAKYPGVTQALIAGEAIVKRNAALLAPPVPVRYRITMGGASSTDRGGQLMMIAAPERKPDGFRVWGTGACDIIPQVDRIVGYNFQIMIAFNTDPRQSLIGTSGEPPKLTGHVAGYPEYNGWVIVTKDGRLPWIPETLADKLDAEGTRRKKALEEWSQGRVISSDIDKATAAELAKQVRDYEQYRASFTAEQLHQPGVWGDSTNAGKRALDAQIATLQRLPPDERGLRITDAMAQYRLTSLKPGAAADAMTVKPDPSFPDPKDPNRIQLIAISFAIDPDARVPERRAWQQRTKDTFDYAALAALLK
jgi:hypothetical protein